MNLDQHIYGSTDWHLPSPSSTPKSVTSPDGSLRTPKTEALQPSHFFDAWSTPRVNGHQTPAQTPSLAVSTPKDCDFNFNIHRIRSPDDPEFHVNHFAANNLPLPPVEPSRRLSSSPGPLSAAGRTGVTLNENPSLRSRPVSMDTSQMQTPPPTRDASSRRSARQQAGNEVGTPATVIARTPLQVQPVQGLFNQTPFGFPSLQFSPDTAQFANMEPLSAPAMPHSRLFWDQPGDSNMDMDMPITSDPFGPTPHKIQSNPNWQLFQSPPNQMNPQAFQALHGISSAGDSIPYATSTAGPSESARFRPSSFVSTSAGVDPSMLFSFSSPGPTASFGKPMQQSLSQENRQPYETQLLFSLEEQELGKRAKSQHSRTSTSSSGASFDVRPGLQRSMTDSSLRKSRPSSLESKSSTAVNSFNIPRRSSPLKRQSGGSLKSIPEIRRPRTRLVIDENGRARTETVLVEDDTAPMRSARRDSPKDPRHQYPGLYTEGDTESDSDEAPITLSRNSSFSMPQRRASKHARTDSGGVERANSLKMPRPSSGIFDRSFETVRPVKKAAENPFRRFSMMDLPTSFTDPKESEDQPMPDSPGDALGALKKVVEGRQKRIERSTQNTLRAHNQRWAQASADMNSNSSSQGHFDPFTNSFSGSPATSTDPGFTTPSTDRSSLSNDSTRCICNSANDGQPMVQCESCNKWLHMTCVGLGSQNLPPVFVCVFCTGQTPVVRGGRVRGPLPAFDSPLTHKSVFRR